MKKLDDYNVMAAVRVDNLAVNANPAYQRSVALDQLRGHLQSYVARALVTETKHEYHTEFRLDLYAVPPDEMYRLIQEEAMRISGYTSACKSWNDALAAVETVVKGALQTEGGDPMRALVLIQTEIEGLKE